MYIFKPSSQQSGGEGGKGFNEGEVTTHQVSLKDVEQVAKLISVEYHMADVVDYHDNKIWPFKDHKILVIAKAKIFAGFDLNKAFHVNIKEVPQETLSDWEEGSDVLLQIKRKFTVLLPSPQIIAIDPSYKYYDIQGKVPAEAHTYVLNLAKVTLHQTALQEGILEDAKNSIKKQLKQILFSYDVDVYFSDTERVSELQISEEVWPSSVEAAVNAFVQDLSEEEREKLRLSTKNELIRYHLSWGAKIRNTFGLWSGNTQLLLSCGKMHPEDASTFIIEKAWEKLQPKEEE